MSGSATELNGYVFPTLLSPSVTAIWERVLFLQIAGEDLAVVFEDLLHRSNPALFGAGVIARVRTLYYAKAFAISSSGLRSYSCM